MKRALLIGVNQYTDDAIIDLRGCENDVADMAALLRDSFRFEERNVVALTGPENTTRRRILDGLTELIEATGSGDVAVVYYSGHGSQVPDESGDEPDSKDETIVPSDSGREGRPVLDIVDDELKSYVRALSERTPYATVIFDSCHSKSVTREIAAQMVIAARRASRAVPRATPAASEPLRVPIQPFPGSVEPPEAPKSETGLFRKGDYLLIAGCQDDETSKEIELAGQVRGVLSYHLIEQLRHSPNASVEAIFEQARPKVERVAWEQDETQRPVLEGPERLTSTLPFSPVPADEGARQGGGPAAAPPAKGEDSGGGGGGGDDTQDDEKKKKKKNPEPGEWDGVFAGRAAAWVVATLAVLAIVTMLLTSTALKEVDGSVRVLTTFATELAFAGMVLAMAGAYIGMLSLRGRMRAVKNTVDAAAPAGTPRSVGEAKALGADQVKDVVEAIGKMPTARGLIVVGGLIVGGAIAFAWDTLPGQLDGTAPQIERQPVTRKAVIGGKAPFQVSASGSDLDFRWKRNGKAMKWATSPTLVISPVRKSDRNDIFTAIVRNEHGVAASNSAKLTLVGKGSGKKGD